MTDYSDIGPIRIDTSFTRPHSGGRDFLAEPVPRDRYSRHSGQNQPRVRDVTWISTSHSQVPSTLTHTPQTPRYAPPPGFQQTRTPTPVLRKSAPTITESELELEAEYMTVSVDDRDECNYQHGYGLSGVMPAAVNGKSEKKNNFVGGFVNGLRRFPKVMSKSRLRDLGKSERQGTGAMAASAIDTGRISLPRYTGPSMPGIPTTNSDDIPTVERLETPPRASSASPRPRQVNPADSDASIGDGRREHLLLSAVREHSFEQSLHPSLQPPHTHSRSDDTSSSSRPPFEREGDVPNAMSTPILANASIRSPILAEPRPSADFMKMESPIRPPPTESVRSQIARAGKFIHDLNRLPWIASSGVSSIYVPGEATTRRYSRPIQKNKGSSWYTSRSKPIDLFAGPSTTGLLPPQPPPSSAMPGPPHSVFPAPFILGSSANLLFTQPAPAGAGGGSGSRSPSHEGPPSTDSHGSQAQVLAPAYVAQPLFVYPSGLPPTGGPPEAQIPRPVYMLANSQPHFMTSGQMDGGSPAMGMGPRLFVPQPSGLRTPTFG